MSFLCGKKIIRLETQIVHFLTQFILQAETKKKEIFI